MREHAILRVVSHLANGAKHFEVSDKRHRSILATETDRYVEEGYNAPGYFEEPLIINLAPDEERELGASVIDVLALGRMVLDFWRPHVATA